MMYSSQEGKLAPPASPTLQRIYQLLAALPLLWLALLSLFTLAVSLQRGHFPFYGDPDPKDTGLLLGLYYPLLALLPAVLVSIPISLAMSLLAWWPRFPLSPSGRTIAVVLLGTLLFTWFAVGDFAGLMTWLAD